MLFSEQHLDLYREQGYIAIPQLFSADEVNAARDALREIMASLIEDGRSGRASYRPPNVGGTGNYDGAWINRGSGNRIGLLFEHSYDPMKADLEDAILHIRKLQYFEQEHPTFQQLVQSPRVKGIAEQLLGEEALLFQTMALVKPPFIGSEKPWHQDNAYFMYAPLESVVGFWMALDDASVENGCMHVLPGWHRRGGLKHFHAGDCQIMPDRLRSGDALAVELRAGGAMFFSGLLPHQTPPNRSPVPRRAVQFHYRGASTRVVDRAEYDRLFAEPDGTPASCAAAKE